MNRLMKGSAALIAGLSILGGLPATTAPSTTLAAQEDIRSQAEQVVSIRQGASVILTRPDSLREVDIADPNVVDVRFIPPNQLVIRGLSVGTTTLIIWGRTNVPRMYTIDVTADIASLQRELDELFPETQIEVRTTGSTVILSGEVQNPATTRKILEVAQTLGVPIVNNLQAAPLEQILLEVEFAEVSRSVVKELGGNLLRIVNPATLDHAFDDTDHHEIETVSEGIVRLMIAGNGSELEAVIRLLKSSGEFRSLAQPNLVTMEGDSASFLAGGEFPYPAVQGNQAGQVTIQFKEFGIRLNFRPNITNSGTIRLQVTPEVSSLDFANGLTFQGFQIPSLVTRRVASQVELRPGQTLAIGGLLDNNMSEGVDKLPILGDIPILGFFFRSEAIRQNRTELLVLVTPHILDSENLPAPPVPTGPPETWEWDGHISDWMRARTDTAAAGQPSMDGGDR